LAFSFSLEGFLKKKCADKLTGSIYFPFNSACPLFIAGHAIRVKMVLSPTLVMTYSAGLRVPAQKAGLTSWDCSELGKPTII